MMNLGRKKSPLPPLSHSSSPSSMFPPTWFPKFRRLRSNSDHKPAKGKNETGSGSWKNAQFYGGDDDPYWRLSFGEENLESMWRNSEREHGGFGPLSYQNCKINDAARGGETRKFNQMASNIQKFRVSPHNEGARGEENAESKAPKRKSKEDRRMRSRNKGDVNKQERDIFELKPVKLTRASKREYEKAAYSSNSYSKTVGEERPNLGWEIWKEMKMEELKAKSENQRRSTYISHEPQVRTSRSPNVRAYSPRTACKIECKIKAIENMKRAKKKKEKKKPVGERTMFDNFAVVKSSYDPQRDFKESMIEMITAKGITKADVLEELLACYLTLNADVYHDTIIKAFRQVWFELNQD